MLLGARDCTRADARRILCVTFVALTGIVATVERVLGVGVVREVAVVELARLASVVLGLGKTSCPLVTGNAANRRDARFAERGQFSLVVNVKRNA